MKGHTDHLEAALHAAGAVSWRSRPADQTISIVAHEGDALASLAGAWRQEEFLNQFDGLSRRALNALWGGRGDVPSLSFSASLANGDVVRFRGAVGSDGEGAGLILSEMSRRIFLEEGRVEPAFQPIVSLGDRRLAGLEVLARFRDSAGRLISPEAEDDDGAVPSLSDIGPLMVRSANDAFQLGEQRGLPLFVQINLSAHELGRPKVVEALIEEIDRTPLPPGRLRVEITEQAALRDVESARGAIASLRAAGAGVVLDDFGAGHSSMVWLCELPVDGVKLDAGVIRAIETPRGMAIVRGLLGILAGLELEVIAEGVEKPSQIEILRDLGCKYAQGFALGAPVSLDQIDALLSAG